MEQEPRSRGDLPIVKLLPNVITLIAICAGLTAIRFGFQGDYERAVMLILAAGFLDGIDGRLARLLRSESSMGAELDSLADFVNFGVAPALLIHSWVLKDLPRAGWIAVLVFAICCVIRLARFNISSKEEPGAQKGEFFIGVPAPAGALMVMFPMYVSFIFSDAALVPPLLMAVYTIVVGLLMISRVPTYSFKNVKISRERAMFHMLGIVLLCAALLTYLWQTLALLVLAYAGVVLWALRTHRKPRDL